MTVPLIKTSTRITGTQPATGFINPRAMLNGAQYTADWLAQMSAEGYMYTINAGTGTAPITGKGVYVSTTPDLDVNIPIGVMCIPVSLNVYYEAVGTNGIQEVVFTCGLAGTFATNGTATTPQNNHFGYGNASGLTAKYACDTAVLPTTVLEPTHMGQQTGITKTTASATAAALDPNIWSWSALQTGQWVHIYNTGSIGRINVWMGGQAPTGFITLTVVVPPLNGTN